QLRLDYFIKINTVQLKLLLLLLLPLQLIAGVSIFNGTVVEATSQLPVAGAMVFVNRSKEFTVTDSAGKFSLIDTLNPTVELVVSKAGFQTSAYVVTSETSASEFRFELVKESPEIGHIDSSKTGVYEEAFLKIFFGTTYNTAETFITNPAILQYSFNGQTGTLSVKSNGLLEIINDGLGYMIHYQLDTFSLVVSNGLSDFQGYCFFTSLSTKKPFIVEKWNMRRQLAYKGSMQHFVKAVYADKVIAEGFSISKVVRYLEGESGYKGALKSKYLVRAGSLNVNGNKTGYADVTDAAKMTSTNTMRCDSANQTYFHYPGPLLVQWSGKDQQAFLTNEEMPQMISLFLFGNQKVKMCANGLYYDKPDLYVQGFMREKIADLLPLEYRGL
ncbi:MAG: carboxypeptidase-like regulatory domain-containing protein, partial [Chitinophagaceae bacterium]|nr:carboxypeptidase-like regulatory domain-containing protein [Chitinophagaceae bacterium]